MTKEQKSRLLFRTFDYINDAVLTGYYEAEDLDCINFAEICEWVEWNGEDPVLNPLCAEEDKWLYSMVADICALIKKQVFNNI